MFSGQEAINYLAAAAIKDDPSASSHWQKYHSEFKFTGQEFSGLQGFGGRTKQPTGLRLWLSLILQRRFKHFGDAYPDINTIDAHAHEVTCKQRRAYDLDVLRQVLTISFLRASAPGKFTANATCCVIGDGSSRGGGLFQRHARNCTKTGSALLLLQPEREEIARWHGDEVRRLPVAR